MKTIVASTDEIRAIFSEELNKYLSGFASRKAEEETEKLIPRSKVKELIGRTSSDTIRRYEREGILKPVNPDSKNKMYRMSDVIALMK